MEFRKTFLDKYTAELLETDLDHDYKAFVRFVKGTTTSDCGEDDKDRTDHQDK